MSTNNNNDSISSQFYKPPLSYIALITLAIKNSPLQMVTLNEVYQYIIANFPYFQENRQKWQNTVRHNLSLNDCFIKIPRRFLGIPGKGNFWALHPQAVGMFNHGSYLRRRRRFRAESVSQTKSNLVFNQSKSAEQNLASIHHIDSKHHFELYGATSRVTSPTSSTRNIDLTTQGLEILYETHRTKRLVPNFQCSLPTPATLSTQLTLKNHGNTSMM